MNFCKEKSLTGCPVKPFCASQSLRDHQFRLCDFLLAGETNSRKRVEQPVQRIATLGKRDQVSAHDVGERVVQAPKVALQFPLAVFGSVPLVENVRQCSLAHRTATIGASEDIVRLVVLERVSLIGFDALGVVAPSVEQLAESTSEDVRKVAQDELGVTASDFDLVVEGEVIADKRSRASVDASGKHFVVRVTQANDSPDVLLLREVRDTRDLKQAEVTEPTASKGVSLLRDGETSVTDNLAQTLDEREVRDRHPRQRGQRSRDFLDFSGFDGMTATV